MSRIELEFDWDEANIGHMARHSVIPEEAEQVIFNDPVISTSARQPEDVFSLL